MPTPTPINADDSEFFVKSLRQIPGVRSLLASERDSRPGSECFSLVLRTNLLEAAVKKNGKERDSTDENLLFPPTVLQNVLEESKVRGVLLCECTLCISVKRREEIPDNNLVGAIIAKEGQEQRKLFAVLIFMGAGFAARHIFSFHTGGREIAQHLSSIQSELLESLEQFTTGIFPSADTAAQIFVSIFGRLWQLFDSPTMQFGSYKTKLDGANLPFINDQVMNADPSSFGSMHKFMIHSEFRGDNIPAWAVRKELPLDDSTSEERQILQFLAECKKANFIQLLFWYQYGEKVNYVFPYYPGSLYQVLDGQLDTSKLDFSTPSKYRTELQHWLWQGMVDLIKALKWFHSPEQTVISADVIAAHFDLKPANILVTENGILLLTDFGQARIKPRNRGGSSMTAQVGDENYRPPPASPLRKPHANRNFPGSAVDNTEDLKLRWTRAYDVWSMACIMTNVIVYIFHGDAGFHEFQRKLFIEAKDTPSGAFWKKDGDRGPKLKVVVQKVLDSFKTTQDRYLIMVTNMIQTMFSIEPLERLSMSECLDIISEDYPTDDWPLKEEDEVPIAGLGKLAQLRNMRTQYVRRLERPKEVARRCRMYLLRSENIPRIIRILIEFEREFVDGQKSNCILSDSARWGEEEFKLMSLFEENYRPNSGMLFKCCFETVHRTLSFIFDDDQRAPDDYYFFLTAVTRQRSLRPYVHMPIVKCTVRLANFRGQKKFYKEGHVQIWKEMTEEEYNAEFTFNPPDSGTPNETQYNLVSPQLSSYNSAVFSNGRHQPRSLSVSTQSSIASMAPSVTVKTKRIVIFLAGAGQPGAPGEIARLLTINLTSNTSFADTERTGDGNVSQLHITFRATRAANFHIGNFESQRDCPGVPLNPETLAAKESLHVDWVDLEFKNNNGTQSITNVGDRQFNLHIDVVQPALETLDTYIVKKLDEQDIEKQKFLQFKIAPMDGNAGTLY